MLKPKGLKKLLELPEDKRAQLDSWLSRNERTMVDIATLMVEQWEGFSKTSVQHLARRLSAYKDQVLKGKLVTELAKAGILDSARRLEEFNAMDELVKLAAAHKVRVDTALEMEKGKPLLTQQVHNASDIYLKVLNSVKAGQLETGAIRRAPKTVSGRFAGRDTKGNERTVVFTMTEETDEAMKVIDGAFQEISG